MVIAALDEVAYLLNLRGSDIAYNPVFYGYVVLLSPTPSMEEDGEKKKGRMTTAILYVNSAQIQGDKKLQEHLKKSGVTIRNIDMLGNDLKEFPKKRASLDPGKCSVWLQNMIRGGNENEDAKSNKTMIEHESSPVAYMKAVKNETEIKGIIEAHEQDAASLTRFLFWIEQQAKDLFANSNSDGDEKNHEEKDAKTIEDHNNEGRAAASSSNKTTVSSAAREKRIDTFDEYFLAKTVEKFRADGSSEFVGPSFATISSFKANGAIIHYKPEKETAAKVTNKGLYLLDSGGQYKCGGTTDVTRTVHLGTPTELERRCFTRVLQGHIALASVEFPEGTPGPKLDVLARHALWKDGLDYRHGTGHGVGSYLNVHEGPHGISASSRNKGIETTGLVPGMLVTNEPG
mmetsp:Transcript_45215/g.72722  ORF Transcript_45215/g.72722 Transcript_45215/m.72722 type:complete len:402 (-) Transcript_45215:730-1935(-)